MREKYDKKVGIVMAKVYKTITEDRDFHKGDIVQHFKRETIVNAEPDSNGRYLYAIQGFATHTETGERLVVYSPVCSNENNIDILLDYNISDEMYARPYEMFVSEVDRDKYPDIKQKYRLEKVDMNAVNIDNPVNLYGFKMGDVVSYYSLDGKKYEGIIVELLPDDEVRIKCKNEEIVVNSAYICW